MKRMRQGKKQVTKPVSKCLIPVIAVPGVEGSVQGSGIRDHILFKLHTAGYLTLRRGLKNLVGASPFMVDFIKSNANCSIPGLGRSPGKGNGNPLQYSYLGNPMDRGAWQTTVHRGYKRIGHDLETKKQQYVNIQLIHFAIIQQKLRQH